MQYFNRLNIVKWGYFEQRGGATMNKTKIKKHSENALIYLILILFNRVKKVNDSVFFILAVGQRCPQPEDLVAVTLTEMK